MSTVIKLTIAPFPYFSQMEVALGESGIFNLSENWKPLKSKS
jgi:hypothetical protein